MFSSNVGLDLMSYDFIYMLFQDQGSKMHRGIGFITFENAGQTILSFLFDLRLKLCIMEAIYISHLT